jgi:hypothetical protein
MKKVRERGGTPADKYVYGLSSWRSMKVTEDEAHLINSCGAVTGQQLTMIYKHSDRMGTGIIRYSMASTLYCKTQLHTTTLQ